MRFTISRSIPFWSVFTAVLLLCAGLTILGQYGCGGGGGGKSLVGMGNPEDSAAISATVNDFLAKVATGDARTNQLLSPRLQDLGAPVDAYRTLVVKDFGTDFNSKADDATYTFFLADLGITQLTADLAKVLVWTQLSNGSRWELTFTLIRQYGQWLIDDIQGGSVTLAPGAVYTGPVTATSLWPVAQGNTWQFAELPISSLSGTASSVRADFRVLTMPGTTGTQQTSPDVGLTSEQFSAPLTGGLPNIGVDWVSLRFGQGTRASVTLPALERRIAASITSGSADLWSWLDPFGRGGWRLSTAAGLTYHGPDSSWNSGEPWRLTGLVVQSGTVTQQTLTLPHINGGQRFVAMTVSVLENIPLNLPSGPASALRLEIQARDTTTGEETRTTWLLVPGTGLAAYLSFDASTGLPSRLGLLLKAEVGGRKVQVSPGTTEIRPPAISAPTFALVATFGTQLTWDATVSNGLPPYTWRLIDAPAWLILDNNGRLTGTPLASGTFTAIVELADNNGFVVRKTLTVTVLAPSGPFVPIIPPTPPGIPPLTLVSTVPAANATGIAASSVIDLQFGEPVAGSSISSATIHVRDASGTLLPGSFLTTGNLVRFTPAVPLPSGTTISIQVTTGVRSLVGGTLTSAVSFSFSIAPAPVQAPPLALADAFSGNEDATVVVPAVSGLLINDSDPAGQGLSAILSTGPATGSLTLNTDGSFSYVPLANANGAVSFSYRAVDAFGLQSPAASVTITLAAVNDAPSFLMNTSLAVGASASLQVFPGWAYGFNAGPADEAGQTLSFVATTTQPGLFATLPAIASNGTLTLAPNGTPFSGIPVSVVLKDNGGTANNGSDTSVARLFTIDLVDTSVAPVVTGPTLASTSQPTWTWTPGSSGQMQFRCRLDDPSSSVGETLTAATSFTPSSPLSNGVHTLYVQQLDSLGAWSVQMSWAITIDTQAPAAPVVTAPVSTTDVTPQWTWTGDTIGGAGIFRVALDGLDISTATETNATTFVPLFSLVPGTHVLAVQERDIAGNWSGSGSAAVLIVTNPVPPVAPVVAGPIATSSARPQWTWTGDPTNGAGFFRVALDGADITVAGELQGTSFIPASPLTEGAHILAVQERNTAGIWSPSGLGTITIDLTSPAAPTLAGPIATSSAQPRWAWTGDSTNGAGFFRVALDGADITVAPEASVTSFIPASPLAEGAHTLAVQERDAVGNWSTSGIGTISVDLTPPAAPLLAGPIATSSAQPRWTWTGDSTNGAGYFRVALDGADISLAAEVAVTSFIPASPLTAGAHTLAVQERDLVGNWSTSGIGTISIYLTAPAAPILAGPIATSSAQPRWTWTGDSTNGAGYFRFALDGADITIAPETATTSFIPASPLTEGAHTLEVQERNPANTWSTSGFGTMTIDLTGPAAPILAGPIATSSAQPQWTWTGDSTNGAGYFRFAIDGTNITLAPETASTTFTPLSSLTDGDHVLEVQERDVVGNWSTSGLGTITVDATPPGAPLLSGTLVTSNPMPNFIWSPADGTGDGTYRYKLDDEDFSVGAVVSSDTSFTPSTPLTEGTHTLYVQARDAVGNWSASGLFATTIDSGPPPAPIFATPLIPAGIGSLGNGPDQINAALKNAMNQFVIRLQNTAAGAETGSLLIRLIDSSANAVNNTPVAITSGATLANYGGFALGALSGLSNGDIVIEASIEDAAGNRSASVTTTLSDCLYDGPVAVLANVPSDPTDVSSATITVLATGAVYYKFILDGAGISSEFPIGDPIVLTGLNVGQHTVQVLASPDGVGYQPLSWAASTTFTYWPWRFSRSIGGAASTGRFKACRGTAFSPDGTLIAVTDLNTNALKSSVHLFRPDGTPLRTLEVPGSSMTDLGGVAIDKDNNIFILNLDIGEKRIYKFSQEGESLATSTSLGDATSFPRSVAVDPNTGMVYVGMGGTGTEANSIMRFDNDLDTAFPALGSQRISGINPGSFSQILGIAADENSDLYVIDSTINSERVHKYSSALASWAIVPGIVPAGKALAVDNQYLYIAKSGLVTTNAFLRYDKVTGTAAGAFGPFGTSLGQFVYPSGIAVNATAGYVIVSDAAGLDGIGSARSTGLIQRFNRTNIDFPFDLTVDPANDLLAPRGIAVAPTGKFHVVDNTDGLIKIFSPQGLYEGSYGGDAALANPLGIAIDAAGNSYVADNEGNRLVKFEFANGMAMGPFAVVTNSHGVAVNNNTGMVAVAAGSGVEQFALSDLSPTGSYNDPNTPADVAYDNADNLIVVEFASNRIQVLNPDLTASTSWGIFGSADGELYRPGFIKIDSDGNYLIGDNPDGPINPDAARIQKFTPSGLHLGTIISQISSIHYFGIAVTPGKIILTQNSDFFDLWEWVWP